MDIEVDPETLRAAAHDLTEAAALLEQGYRALGSGPLGVPAQPGWSATETMAATLSLWTAHLDRLHDGVAASAASLTASADNYDASQWHVMAHVKRLKVDGFE